MKMMNVSEELFIEAQVSCFVKVSTLKSDRKRENNLTDERCDF